jgi:hypothetical protein
MFIIEDYPQQNPYYHSANDTLDTLNLEFHTNVTRSLVAAIASIGGVSPNEDLDNDGIPNDEDNCPGTPNQDQEDTYPPQGNGIGDACDCECDFNCDGNVDGADAGDFLLHFGRSIYFNPCTNADPCNGDVDCNTAVDGFDVSAFLEDFGRSQYFNPCPQCEVGNWCVY